MMMTIWKHGRPVVPRAQWRRTVGYLSLGALKIMFRSQYDGFDNLTIFYVQFEDFDVFWNFTQQLPLGE